MTALRAFEAAARLGGFAAAAGELSVTPGAVAQQIKALEGAIGAKLFIREARGVALTGLGAAAAADLGAAFDQLGAAAAALRAGAGRGAVRIAALPAVAQLWLSPRLAGLRRAAPEITVSVSAVERAPNLLREPFDIALFYETATGAGVVRDLGADMIFPVCAPAVARRLRRPPDLAREILLTDAAWAEDWMLWAATTPGAPRLTPAGPVFSLYALAVEAAESGGGVLIGHDALVRRAMRAGRLVAPFPERTPTGRRLTLSVAPVEADAAARIAAILAAG